MLLLFAQLGGERPLGGAAYRGMLRMLEALGPGEADFDNPVTERELRRLGVSQTDAGRILERLDQEALLDKHLDTLARLGLTVVTRISPDYPERLRQVLGVQAPMLLYCAGALELFQGACMSLVGSRRLRSPGEAFARRFGTAAAEEGITYVSGGAAGADTVGFQSAWSAGGAALVYLADSLQQRVARMQAELATGRVLLVSEYGYDQPFSVGRAYSRNRLIHAMGQAVFVAQCDYGTGGTWNGVMENLKAGWCPVFVSAEEPEDPGTRGLVERGCSPLPTEALGDLRALTPQQTTLF